MAEINQWNLRVFARLIKYGFDEEKKIFDMGIESLTHIPKITPTEIQGIADLQRAIREKNILSFFMTDTEQTEKEEPEDEA